MAKETVVLVTGANRGIGLAICRAILGLDLVQKGSLTLYAASRDGVDLKLASPSSHKSSKKITGISYPKLDITSPHSIQDLASAIRYGHGGLDVLINNAGLNRYGSESMEDQREIFNVNFWGTLDVCRRFLPLMRQGGRVVNLSSVGSTLNAQYGEDVKRRLRDPEMTLEQLQQLARTWEQHLIAGTSEANGFPTSGYSVSKAAVNAMTRVLSKAYPDLIINCCCPGWVDTEMGRQVGSKPLKTADDGAAIPCRLAFGDVQGCSGEYWANPDVSSKASGSVQAW